MIDIRDKKGNLRYSVEVSERAIYHKELMAEEYVLLTFETAKLVRFKKGDYIETEFGRFEIVKVDKPERNISSDGGWSYEQKFNPPWAKWVNRKMFYNRQKGSEKAWKMTQLPKYFMQILVDNIRDAGFGDWSYTIDESLTEMKLVEFDGTNILDALTRIAETWETEWWITDNVIHLSKCEYGSPVVFEEGDAIQQMQQEDGQDTDYITRLYAFGSTRNVPQDYRKNEDDTLAIEGVVERRLKLPVGIDHIDAWDDMQPEDVVEGIVVLDEIYPHRVGTMSNITTKEYTDKIENEDGTTEEVKWNAYRFTDAGIKFSKEYIIPGEELRIIFQSGTLAGMDFAVTFNPDGIAESQSGAQLWEIVRNEDYGIALPNENFKPSDRDKYILYGYDTNFVSDRLIPEAEQELLAKAHEIILKKSQDKSIYNCPTNPIRCAGYKERNGKLVYLPSDVIDLDLGQAVELRSENHFDSGYRVSRVRSFEKRLDNRYNCTYVVGESSAYSKSAELNEKVEAITYNNTQYVSGGGGVYVIKRHDGTAPSDHNVYSSLRAKFEFLNKHKPDTATALQGFMQGVTFGEHVPGKKGGSVDGEGNAEYLTAVIRELLRCVKFVDGLTGEGWQIWIDQLTGLSHLTIDKATIRQSLVALELLIQKVRSIGGQFIVSAANGKIKDVIRQGENYRILFEQECGFVAHDLVRCATFGGTQRKAYWVEVSAGDATGITVPLSEFGGVVPEPGDECVLMGNTENRLRRNLISISAAEDGQPRIDILDGVQAKNFNGCLRCRLGNLDGIKDSRFPANNQPHGNGLYADNVYLRGTFLLMTGEDILTKFYIIEGKIESAIEGVKDDLASGNSYLSNPNFSNGIEKWDTQSEAVFFLLGNRWIWANNNVLTNKVKGVSVTKDNGRTVLRIRNNHIIQRNVNMRSIPKFEENEEGKKEALPVYLSFFYRCRDAGILNVKFDNVDKTGFENFNSMDVTEELAATEGYVQYQCNGLWNGTGDFRLSFTGDICLYMLVLTIDKVESLAYKYKTLFEQSERLVKISAAVYDKDENLLRESGLMVQPDGTTLYAIDENGEMRSSVEVAPESVAISAKRVYIGDRSKKLGDVFMVDDGGNVWANDLHLKGILYRIKTEIDINDPPEGVLMDFMSGNKYFDFKRIGSMVSFIGESASTTTVTISLPSIDPRNDLTEESQKDTARAVVGAHLTIFNNTEGSSYTIVLNGFITALNLSGVYQITSTYRIPPGDMADLVCEAVPFKGGAGYSTRRYEAIGWRVIGGAMRSSDGRPTLPDGGYDVPAPVDPNWKV